MLVGMDIVKTINLFWLHIKNIARLWKNKEQRTKMFYNIEDKKVRFLVDKSGVQEITLEEAEIFALKLLNDIDKAR